MDTSVLEGIGMSQTEIKVFIALLELGESKAGKIIEKTGLQSSSVYNSINSLISKGIVSYIKKSEVKYYRSADPSTILSYIDSKKAEYTKLLPELLAKQNKLDNEGVEYYKSFKGIKTLLSKLVKDANRGEIYRTFSIQNPEDYELAKEKVLRSVKHLFRQKRLIVRGIFNEHARKSKSKDAIMNKRYVPFSLPPNTSIFNDKVAMISWQNEPSGILINSKDIAQQYIEFFDYMWKMGKK